MMMTLDDFRRCVVVLAHPDDEALWASSLLAAARKIVLCYEESPGYPAVGAGRRALLKDFPLQTAVSLEIPESDVLLAADWARPVETAYGIAVSRNGDDYAQRFHRICEALEGHIEDGDVVVTHNPWGEYGHEEHVQVHRAVAALRQKRDFRLFVTGYVSDRSLRFMEMCAPRLGPAVALLPTDRALGEALMWQYQAHGIWTWDDAYRWPGLECFYEIPDPAAPLCHDKRTLVSPPLNMLWFDGRKPLWRMALRNAKRRLRALASRARTGR